MLRFHLLLQIEILFVISTIKERSRTVIEGVDDDVRKNDGKDDDVSSMNIESDHEHNAFNYNIAIISSSIG